MRLTPRVVLAGSLLPAAVFSCGCEMMIAGPRAQAADVWEKTYAVNPGATLEVENTNGAIEVRTHTQPTIVVVARRTAKAMTEQGAKELLSSSKLEEGASADLVRLVTPKTRSGGIGQQLEVQYEISVPVAVAVTLTTVNGKVDVDGVGGAVALETVNGGIDGRNIGGLRRAETVNGSVSLRLTALPRDGAKVETVNGGVSIALPPTAAADVSVRTVNGGITVDGFASVSDAERKRRHYDGRLNGGGPDLRVETVNGGVRLNGREPATTTADASGTH